MAPLLQNPAMAGANYDLQALINYKNQWASVADPYKTFDVSFDMKLNKKKAEKGFWAGGINIFSDKAGDSQMGTTAENLSLAYHVILNPNSTLGGGVTGGFVQRSVNTSQLQWMSQYDGTGYNPALPTGETSAPANFSYPDLGAGIVWAYNKGETYMTSNTRIKANIGLSVFHPHQPAYSFYGSGEKLHMKTVFHGNVLYGIKNTNLSLVPGYVVYLQGSNKEILFGSMFRYTTKESSKYTGYVKGSAIGWGLHYRNNDALVASFLLEMGQYALGISYDVNVSKLKTASSGKGGFEIALRFVNPNPFLYSSKARFD
jgi:type IX secretion system PorP/SprF family membrane protein